MKLKIAQTAKELDDVFWLRHEVYVLEEGKFGGKPLPESRIIDRFDAFSDNVSIIAYDGDEPVGTIRVGMDSGLGLATEKYFDLTEYRQATADRWMSEQGTPPIDACASMLAVRKQWKNRRDVIRALLKMAIGIWNSWGITHAYVNVVAETAKMYARMGFVELTDWQWLESVGYSVVPIMARLEDVYQWAFGNLQDPLLESYSGHFERVLLKPGEILFAEGEPGEHAYMVDEGAIKISRTDLSDRELILSTLEQGDMFGELALIDAYPRSATATALKATELIVLDRKTFQQNLSTEPRLIDLVMRNFSKRIRRMDDLAMVLAYGASTQRLHYALQTLRKQAKADVKEPETLIVKVTPNELANLAGVCEESAVAYLQSREELGELTYTHRAIRFLERRTHRCESHENPALPPVRPH